MKKWLFIAIAAFAVQSCTTSDNNTPTSSILLQSTVQSMTDASVTTTYHYNGNKLAHIDTDSGETIQYTYTGNNITAINMFNPGGFNIYHFTFTYSGGQLVESIRDQVGTGQRLRQTFAYPDAVTITGQTFITDAPEAEELLYDQTYTIGTNGEITTLVNSSAVATMVYTYNYDNKNNPFMNVTGYQQLMMLQGFDHNILDVSVSDNDGVAQVQQTAYEYNGDGFPQTSSTVQADGSSSATAYYY